MTSKAQLLELCASMVEDGEGDLLYPEMSECLWLKELYEKRMQCLLDRDPQLALVEQRAVHLYAHCETHFRKRILENSVCVDAATEILSKWQKEKRDSKKSMTMQVGLESKRTSLPFDEQACK